MMRWFRLLRLVFVLGAAGAAAPGVSQDTSGNMVVAAAYYVTAQRLVAVEGARRLNLFCLGQGRPTVLLDAGSGGSTVDWRRVQGSLAQSTRTCAYDRAGYGFSDPALRPSDARNAVDDLHRLVAAAGLEGKLVLVGHSNGGLYATLYVETYPAEIGGLVLIDPGYPGQQNYDSYGLGPRQTAGLKAWTAGLVADASRCVVLARAGKLTGDERRPSKCLDDPPNPDPAIHQALDRQYATPAYQEANLSEFQSSFATTDGITTDDREMPSPLHPLTTAKLIVLTASRHPAPASGFTASDQATLYAVWKHAHDRLAALSSTGQNIVVANSGHFIQDDRPDEVLRAVRQVIDALRHGNDPP